VSLLNKIKERSREYYRFVIMDNATFEEKVVVKLKPLSIFVAFVTLILLLIILSISLVAFTPLREYIPGYGSTKQEKKIMNIQMKVDSLGIMLSEIETYGQDVKAVLLGKDFIQDTISATDTVKNEDLLWQCIWKVLVFIRYQDY